MEKNRMDCQRELYREIAAYLQHINFARNCCVAYKSLYDNIQKNEQILSNAVGFFTITRYALSKCLLIELSKLFHGSDPQRTVRKLIRKVRGNQNAFIAANQEAQTATLLRRLGAECPQPAYLVNAPTPVNFPTDGCGNVRFGGWNNGGNGCGCRSCA